MGLWMVLREITSSLLYFYLPIFHLFIPLLPLQIQWGINQMPLLSKNVLVLALFSVSSYSLQSLQSLDTCSIHQVQGFSCVWLSEMMHCFDFCPYLCMFLTYAQLLVSWREEMHWPVSAWLYVRLNFKTLDTWRIPVSIHMWVCVCVGPSGFFWDFWKVLSVAGLASEQNQSGGYAELWKPGEKKAAQRMIPFTGRDWGDSHIIQSGDIV